MSKETRKRGTTTLTTERVRKHVEDEGCILMSEYINKKTKIEFECRCGTPFSKTYTSFRAAPRCKNCSNELNKNKKITKHTFESVQELFINNGCVLLEVEYKNKKTKMKYICVCGNESSINMESFSKGGRCKDCGYKNRKNPLQYTILQVKEFLNDSGCELLSDNYKNQYENLVYKCSCGEIEEKSFHLLLNAPRCAKCSQELRVKNQRYKYEEVEKIFFDAGCLLLDDEYINSGTPLAYRCNCGNESTIRLSNFINGERCLACYPYRNTKYTISYVKSMVEAEGCKYLSQDKEHSYTRIDFICICGNEGNTTVHAFKLGVRCVECGKKKYKEKVSGENNYWWNPNISEEDRLIGRTYSGYSQWRKDVLQRDDYTCQCCGDKPEEKLNVHHKDGHHWCAERRIDVTNGVTLCEPCHIEFHLIYSKKNNTESQYIEFENYKKNKLLN